MIQSDFQKIRYMSSHLPRLHFQLFNLHDLRYNKQWFVVCLFNVLVNFMRLLWFVMNVLMEATKQQFSLLFDRKYISATQLIAVRFHCFESLTDTFFSLEEVAFRIKMPSRRSLLVEFTCDSCGERTEHLINRAAYEKGTIFLQVFSVFTFIFCMR